MVTNPPKFACSSAWESVFDDRRRTEPAEISGSHKDDRQTENQFKLCEDHRETSVPTGNAEVFEMMEITHLPQLISMCILPTVISVFRSAFRSRAAVELENFALRHQLNVLKRSVKHRPRLTSADRLLWVVLSRLWADWRSALTIVQPETVIAWHRKAFRLFWSWKVRNSQPGRPAVSREVRDLIRRMSRENPLWGAPHIHGELLKLGIHIGETSVAKYMVRRRQPPSHTWRAFLNNHVKTLVSVDFFTVPTIGFRVLYVFLVLAHERRRVVHFNVTAHPTAEWTAQQLREAFPFDQIPRYLLRDRDKIFGDDFRRQVSDMQIQEVLSAPRSPWQ